MNDKVTHGLSGTKIYFLWRNMRTRCYNSNAKDFKNYGGRGITMCRAWLENKQVFFVWALLNGYKDGLQIDRIDNNGNYEPCNCRFVTSKENMQNRCCNIMYDGKTLAENCRLRGLKYNTINSRIRAGWPIEKALRIPTNVTVKEWGQTYE